MVVGRLISQILVEVALGRNLSAIPKLSINLKKENNKIKRKESSNSPRNVTVLFTNPVPLTPFPHMMMNMIMGSEMVKLVLIVLLN